MTPDQAWRKLKEWQSAPDYLRDYDAELKLEQIIDTFFDSPFYLKGLTSKEVIALS